MTPPHPSPLVEKVSRAMAAADGYVSLTRAGNAHYDSLALAAVRVVVEEACNAIAYDRAIAGDTP